MNNNRQPATVQEPTNSCPACDETARRDEKLIDALQLAMNAIVAVDGFDDW